MSQVYVALLDRYKGEYGVVFPDFPGCTSAGISFEDALANATDALAFHVESMKEDGDSIPKPRTLEQIKAAKEDWIDWKNVTAALIPLIEPSGQVKPANVTFDSALLNAIDRYAEKTGSSRSAVLAEGAKMVMAARPAKRAHEKSAGKR